ncbi:MAG: hypothetical protein EBY39_02840 [Flavobacteriia bacterium]|nr:hypothetical protein [Flavobacteriia bacterium]
MQKKCRIKIFFLAIKLDYVIIVVMKAREIKIRKTILFTKSRPHKVKKNTLHRKLKHKEILRNEH